MPTFLTLHDILSALQVSKSALYQWIRDGKFPAPTKIGKTSRWNAETVNQALAKLSPPNQ
ncbi:AlpA family transcriptional regulator [Chitinibacter sp. GC72]|uniref:helix-turn-helix transcriptional regulator n=1 Tax=Chitinibacter sp. GC72 TaxID=1526917 RepID=UPI0012FC3287|nr:helix-turn-helix domain-containing protein [Chitinibacter sp. GC72]